MSTAYSRTSSPATVDRMVALPVFTASADAVSTASPSGGASSVPKIPKMQLRSMPPMRLPGSKLPTSSPAVPWPPGRASAMTAESTLPSRSGMSTPLVSSEMPWPSAP